MVCGLFVGVGDLDHVAVVVRTADEADAGWEIVAREASRHNDGRDVNQKRI